MKLINLTGHDVTLIQVDGKSRTIPAEGHLRLESRLEDGGYIRNRGLRIPLINIVEEVPVNLPDAQDDTLFIVSGVAAARAKRADFVTPSKIARKDGRVIGCYALARVQC